jgi:tRNA(Arg) A34 adenosine deaminase TadA
MTASKKSDDEFLEHAIKLSEHALKEQSKTPFGAILVIDGEVVSEGTSSVIQLADPTAHAEIMALRNAGKSLGRHLFPDAVMYASSEPCPMCLVACYWARISRLVFGASSYDVGAAGFEDLQLYRELMAPVAARSLREQVGSSVLRTKATRVLEAWAENLPQPVQPKL